MASAHQVGIHYTPNNGQNAMDAEMDGISGFSNTTMGVTPF